MKSYNLNKVYYKNIINKWFSIILYTSLETIGNISPYALKKGRKRIIDKKIFLDIPYSFLSMLVGLIDGDGHISVTKTNKGYIKICLVLSFNIRDLSLLYYINSILGLGKINTYPKLKTKDTCKLVINKTDLQGILFPLLRYHNLFFLTKERKRQYDKVLFILENNVLLFEDIPKIIPSYNILPLNSAEYLKIKFFHD
jgi:hypothetical protein